MPLAWNRFQTIQRQLKHKTPTHVSTVCRSTISLSIHLSLWSLVPFSKRLNLWRYGSQDVSCEPKRTLLHPEHDRSTARRFSPLQAILASQTFRFACDQKNSQTRIINDKIVSDLQKIEKIVYSDLLKIASLLSSWSLKL